MFITRGVYQGAYLGDGCSKNTGVKCRQIRANILVRPELQITRETKQKEYKQKQEIAHREKANDSKRRTEGGTFPVRRNVIQSKSGGETRPNVQKSHLERSSVWSVSGGSDFRRTQLESLIIFPATSFLEEGPGEVIDRLVCRFPLFVCFFFSISARIRK